MKRNTLFVKSLCLLLVSAFLMVAISATDVITPELDKIALPEPEPATPQSTCYIEKTVSGVWKERWYTSMFLDDAWFEPSQPAILKNPYYNGHQHTGTLTHYEGVDPGTDYVVYDDPDIYGSSYYIKEYTNASAVYSGNLPCGVYYN